MKYIWKNYIQKMEDQMVYCFFRVKNHIIIFIVYIYIHQMDDGISFFSIESSIHKYDF